MKESVLLSHKNEQDQEGLDVSLFSDEELYEIVKNIGIVDNHLLLGLGVIALMRDSKSSE